MTEATATKGKIRKPRQAIGEGPRTRFALIAMALLGLAHFRLVEHGFSLQAWGSVR